MIPILSENPHLLHQAIDLALRERFRVTIHFEHKFMSFLAYQ